MHSTPTVLVNQPAGLLVIPFGQLRRNRSQITKQPSGAMVWSGGEVHLCGGGGGGISLFLGGIFPPGGPHAPFGERASPGIPEQTPQIFLTPGRKGAENPPLGFY